MMPRKKYLFIISNTNRSDEDGSHWWSILNISPKSKLFLDLFGISGNGYKNLTGKEIFNLSSAAQDFFHLIYSFGKNENITKLFKRLDAWRSNSNRNNNNLWTVSAIFLRKIVFSRRKQQTTKLQKINKRCPRNNT